MVKQRATSAKKKVKSTSVRAKKRVVKKKKTVKQLSSKKSGTVKKKASSAKSKQGKAKRTSSVSSTSKPAKKTTKSKRKKMFTASEMRKMRNLLINLRESIIGQINFLAKDNLSRSQNDAEINFRSEEQGTDNYDRDFALNRVSLEQDNIFEIDEALNRIQIGTYGICEICKHPIEKARLMARPYAKMCISCKALTETKGRANRSFETPSIFPNAGKSSLRTNEDN